MSNRDLFVSGLLLLCGLSAKAIAAGGLEVVEVRKIWGETGHCAFTDIVRLGGQWYCTFRESDAHVYGRDGKIRVITSVDGEDWQSAVLLVEEGVDLRDPKLSVTPDGRLMLLMGGSAYEGRTLVRRQCRVAFSRDGKKWTRFRKVLSDGEWLWRVTWHDGMAWGVSYSAGRGDKSGVRLYRSVDGVKYEEVTEFDVAGRANETTVRFLEDGRMVALVRREGSDPNAVMGSSEAPYTDWKWLDAGHRVGGPNFIVLPGGEMWGGGRSYPGGAKTVLARLTEKGYEPMLTLPSGGDTSYPGFVWHEGLLWMSYYSSHEGKASIYLAKIQLR